MSKTSESHFKVMATFGHLASHIEREGGFFQSDDLNQAEIKTIASRLRTLADHYEELGIKNQSIGN
jgi:hypothetical protein